MSSPDRLPEAHHRGGSGEPMVLVHGIGGSWRNWTPMLPALERQHDVLAVGLLGHYGCGHLPEGVRASVAALCDGVEHEMDQAGLQTGHLVGNSLGGWIVLELAKRGRARSVVAISPGGGFRLGSLSADLTAVRLVLEHRVVRRFLASRAERLTRSPHARRALFSGVAARPRNIDAAAGADLLRGFGGAEVFESLLAGMRRDGALGELEAIRAPVLLLWGTRDTVLPARWFAPMLRDGIPGAEFRALAGLGHVPMIDAPELVAGHVLEFVARHRAGPAERASGAAA